MHVVTMPQQRSNHITGPAPKQRFRSVAGGRIMQDRRTKRLRTRAAQYRAAITSG